MKKVYALILASLVSVAVFAETTTTTTTSGLNPFKDYTHWSLSVNGGISQFDGDVKQTYNEMTSESRVSWTVGIDVEYTFNPIVGLLAEFQYIPYMGRTSTISYGVNDIVGQMFDPSLQVSINLANLFNPYRKTWRWSLYLNAGIGATFYSVKSTRVDGTAPGQNTPKEIKDGRSLLLPLGLHVEYNINKYLAVGLRGYYRLHNKDYFEGQDYTKGTMNDGEFTAEANLRVKFVPNKKEGGHMRNVSMWAYRRSIVGEKNFQDDLDSLKKRVQNIEDTLNNSVLPRIAALEQQLSPDAPDSDGDGIPDVRDREPNSAPGSLVNWWGESLPADAAGSAQCCNEIRSLLAAAPAVDYDLSVYFGFDKSNLTPVAKRNVETAAKLLQEHPEWKVELRGYCDFPGGNDYNVKLSQRRVETVKKELMEKYNIEESRISLNARGQMENPPHADYRNRRCDFVFGL